MGRDARFSSAAGVLLLAGLGFLIASSSGAALELRLNFHLGKRKPSTAARLAEGVGAVKGRFDAGRAALPTVKGPAGPVHPRPAVTALIDTTEGDLDRAIAQVGVPGLVAMRRWAAEEFRRVRSGLDAPVGARTAALSGPQAVAVVASLGGRYPVAAAAVRKPDPRERARAEAEAAQSNQALDWVGRMVERLFVLAKNDDLEVKLWVGSTPAQRATFRFWSEAYVEGSRQGPSIIQTNGKRKGVLRGLYSYSAALGGGPAIEYPPRGGARLAGLDPRLGDAGTERLDLVNGSSFFCCRFEEKYCHHVDDEKDCQADPR